MAAKDREEGDQEHGPVGGSGLHQQAHPPEVDQLEADVDQGPPQDRDRDVIGGGGQEPHDGEHQHPGVDDRQAGDRPGLEVHGGPGEGPRRGEAADQARSQIAHPLADELAIGIEGVPNPRGQELADGDGLHRPEQADGHGGAH